MLKHRIGLDSDKVGKKTFNHDTNLIVDLNWNEIAGEILDVDGITGGFNFQAAWTTAFIASKLN